MLRLLSYYPTTQDRSEFEQLVSSYVHMTINRMFRNKQRLHELVIYDFLRKKYTNDLARKVKA